MRPKHLELEGFGPFREHTVLDFADLDFFALVGPTGGGKSTVIDAICFALYGHVPRYDDKRLVSNVVSAGAREARVLLEFDTGGSTYVVVRRVVLDAKGRATQKDPRLERVTDGGTDALAGTVREVDEAVTRLVGLAFDQFTTCVVLPQGEFARFLKEKPGRRQDLLVDLLGYELYERVGERARERAKDLRGEARAATQRLEELRGATSEALAAAVARRTAIAAFGEKVQAAAPADAEMAAAVAAAERSADDAAQQLAFLAKVRVPDPAATLGERIDAARRAIHDAAALVETRQAAADQLAQALRDAPELSELTNARQAHDRLARLDEDLRAFDAERAAADQARTSSEAELAAARRRRETADEALAEARDVHSHATLRASLVVGAPCPVCEQKVRALPKTLSAQQLTEAQQQAAAAAKAEQRAHDAHRTAHTRFARVGAQLDALASQRRDLVALVEHYPDQSALDELIAATAAARNALDAAQRAVRTARDAHSRAVAAEQELATEVERAERAYHAQRDPLVGLQPPAPASRDVVASWQALAAWAAERRPEVEHAVEQYRAEAAKLREEQAAAVQHLVREAGALGIPAASDLSQLAQVVATVHAHAERDASDLARQIDEARRLRERQRDVEERAGVADALGTMLRAERFERWLVEGALADLVEYASRTLYQLSGGLYSLALDDGREFVVVDHANADERRSARTLSGGETFQASLALALALADRVAELSARGTAQLDAIFLDEGFGTLDPEALESVAGTIETLGTGGRMVGIVTHVRELAARVPVRFEVRKGTRTSTIERVAT